MYTDFVYRNRLGNLNDKEAFALGFVLAVLSMVVFQQLSNRNTKVVGFMKQYQVSLLLLPFVLGLISIVNNRLKKDLGKSKMRTYQKHGFDEKEAKEQTLDDIRHSEWHDTAPKFF
jgi:UDP-N-acetylmuramyl pentapeptide phosphotransferase/UDP-N-acetylglucosamine-1-phosphate transferase